MKAVLSLSCDVHACLHILQQRMLLKNAIKLWISASLIGEKWNVNVL